MSILFRYATEDDTDSLKELLLECFGKFAIDADALSDITKYTIAEYTSDKTNEKQIVAMSGIVSSEYSIFPGYEVMWTCTTKAFRRQGLITSILKQAEQQLPNDHIPLYCDCWRINDNEHINLYSVMKHLGMHKVIGRRVSSVYPHCKQCSSCVMYTDENCHCMNDLYIKER